jgi:hypothetical protein
MTTYYFSGDFKPTLLLDQIVAATADLIYSNLTLLSDEPYNTAKNIAIMADNISDEELFKQIIDSIVTNHIPSEKDNNELALEALAERRQQTIDLLGITEDELNDLLGVI